MVKSKMRTRVNSALALSAAGMLAAFPFRDYFGGGLLFSLCNAATIGGLADSFAVGALFGNPLKIKWPAFMGTRVIERNRARLVAELGHMVQHELLTPANIEARLNEYSISGILLRYLKEHGGQEDIAAIADRLIDELLEKIDVQELAETLRELLLGNFEAIQAANIVADIADWTITNGYDELIIDFLLRELIRIAETERFRLVLEGLADSVLSSYENGQFKRQFVNIAAGLEAAPLSGKIQQKIVDFLTGMLAADHAVRMQIKEQLHQFTARLKTDQKLIASIESGKINILNRLKLQIRLDEYITRILNALKTPDMSSPESAGEDQFDRHEWLHRKIAGGIDKLEMNSELLQSLDFDLKTYLLQWIRSKHSFIAKVVTDKLDTYSMQELTELVQEKAGRDLQYIRLNGTAVGGLIGVLLYLFTFWIGG